MTEAVFFLGAVLVAVGLGFIYWPLAPIFLGLFMMVLAYCAATTKVKHSPTIPMPDPDAIVH